MKRNFKFGLRFDQGEAVNATIGTIEPYNYTMWSGLWTTVGVDVKGDNDSITNNLCFDSQPWLYYLVVVGITQPGPKQIENLHTLTARNVLQKGACSGTVTKTCTYIATRQLHRPCYRSPNCQDLLKVDVNPPETRIRLDHERHRTLW